MPSHVAPFIEAFSDFAGTIALKDTGCILIDAGFGADNRKAVEDKIIIQELMFLPRDLLWKAVSLTYAEGVELLRPVQIDPRFLKFRNYALKHHVPFTVVSCGLDFIIQEYLAWHLGDESKITILANYGKVIGDKWLVTYRDDSPYTHDKSVCIKQAKQAFSDKSDKIPGQEHIIVFCGDGISDWSVTRKADILFARRGLDLEKYCRKHKIPFIVFDTFDKVTATVQGLTEGTLTVAEVNCRSECAN
ncbi:hypothetical protein MVEG_07588 [Podila verticillata NRRL 6337]|nr:hypothetical protein MVEG_07588 [Podila verticillata NRRL 6337]